MSAFTTPGSILGNHVRRVEDRALLTGHGTYVANGSFDGLLHVAFVRSPHAHAQIVGIDTSEAATAPGVIAVYVASDLSLPPMHGLAVLNEHCARPPLAVDRVRFVGEPVAVVVGSTYAAAVDAADRVIVDYEPLRAVTDPELALDPDAPVQFDEIGSNLAAGRFDGPGSEVLDDAESVVRLRMVNQRIAVVPLEGNAITAVPGDDGNGHQLTIWVASQGPHLFRQLVSTHFGIGIDAVRVITPDVGGAFGGKTGVTSEHAVTIAVARRLARPVRWVETRSENLIAMPHGRAQVDYVEMGFDSERRITGLRCRVVGDAGAYAGFGGILPMLMTRMMATGVYRVPKVSFEVAVAITNTTPMGAFRGAGRPEATSFLERIMDLAAAELGVDPVDLRRRNLIGPDEFPATTAIGTRYDSGDYERALDEALRLADYDGWRAEQRRRRASGDRSVIGIGVCTYVEVTAAGSAQEFAEVEVLPDGGATIKVGTSSHGQGHATSFAMIVSDRLGIPIDRIRHIQSDTAQVPRGGGTGGSRSLQIGGNAVSLASDAVWTRARQLAARMMEADAADIVVTAEGGVGVAGVPAASTTWGDLARAAEADGARLVEQVVFTQSGTTFPFGAHVSVVEVDLDTGATTIVSHVAVDDCGRIINPMIVTGQQHGGIAQGVAQALFEQVLYDDQGNPITATLVDYAVPTACELPSFTTANTETPSPLNPLGVKGIGESGTIGATPAVHNAVIDALAHLGVRHVDMPCTPERVWRAVETAAAGSTDPLWREPPSVFRRLPQSEVPDDSEVVGI